MKWFARILHVLLIPLIASAGLYKLMSSAETIREVYTDPLDTLGYSVGFIYAVGVIELLAAVGLIAGFFRASIGFASFSVICIVLAGAVASNVIAGLYAAAVSPLVGLILTVAAFLANRHMLKISSGAAAQEQTSH